MLNHNEGRSAPAHGAFPVVGLGASAGGLTALQAFFEALPATTGAAYVVVLHISPDHSSNLDKVIQQTTSMPVTQITAGIALEPNRVYVIAPSCTVTLSGNQIEVSATSDLRRLTAAIDLFFRSLAEAHRERAVGIVLSGAGSDGSVGIKRIKELGGVTMAQSLEQAEYTSMPRAAIETEMVDFILDASEMPQRLLDLWTHAGSVQLTRAWAGHAAAEGADADDDDPYSDRRQRALREILIVLRTRTGHDFKRYKKASVLRRIERRLQVNGLADLEHYRDYLHTHPEETHALLQDLLASTTHFFRDADAFEALRTDILPLLFARRGSEEPVRVWSAGCATGAEAYSLAMLLHEAAQNAADGATFQVFATDVDERAIEIARQGVYPDAVFVDVEPERVKKYFTKAAGGYRIRKDLREKVLFAVHNVLRDPPFSRLDLICCRNLLVHFDRTAQRDVLRAFHFALRSNGYLFLGASETVEAADSPFFIVDKQARIFSSDRNHPARIPTLTEASVKRDAPLAATAPPVAPPSVKRAFSFGDLHSRLLEEHAFPSVLVNRRSEIVHVSDRAGRFLQFAGGEPSHHVLAAIRPELRVELRTTIYQALQTQHRVDARPVRVDHGGHAFIVRMIARPLHDDETKDDFVLIVFDEMQAATSDLPHSPTPDPHVSVIAQLERELQSMRERLQQTVEEYEVANEELRASNEELMATNEELRATTETLESSKEDLEAVNATLTGVNSNLTTQVRETAKVNDDLHNLITANDPRTIFIDRALRIMRFTPLAKEIFNIGEADIGRPLLDLTHRLQYDKLEADAAQAFESTRQVEREIRSADGRWYLARFLPYRASGDVIDGAVLSFTDITSSRLADERLHSASQSALEEVKRRQDEFLAVVSHELKHPLNLISANAELIARSAWARKEPSLAHAAGTISRTVSGQAQIIDDLLDISRVRTGKLSIVCTAVDFADAVRRICETVRQEARHNDIELALSLPERPVAIEADLTRIEQVIWNLLGNALKYTQRNGRIAVALQTDETLARLTVSDNGIGIDPTVLPYIFEMFQRGQSTGVTQSGGLGIGLSLVKELVAVHGGRVSVRSEGLGRGATFTVELPRLLGEADIVRGGGHPAAFLRNTEVVLVDDDRETVEAFKMLLETEGANVIVATAGDEALRILDDRSPSFILSDLGMPGMSGVELIVAVRKRDRLANVKAIALSGFGRDSDVQSALRAGFDAHLTKPVTLDALLDTMARLRAR
ncbi:CheR family methyltransferase [Trinickia sp.]|uniref:CheR family methyltransferase n=1 Tax=Trinickia sp. TaxID=2571163 RepID=UPI003F810BBE